MTGRSRRGPRAPLGRLHRLSDSSGGVSHRIRSDGAEEQLQAARQIVRLMRSTIGARAPHRSIGHGLRCLFGETD